MGRLSVYQWERERWPRFRTVILCSEDARKYVGKLSKHFKLPQPSTVVGSLRTYDGRYKPGFGYPEIHLHSETGMNLGTLCHEFAHHLDRYHYKGKGHKKTFKRALKRTYTWAKRWVPNDSTTKCAGGSKIGEVEA